jgi:hypothetical protein
MNQYFRYASWAGGVACVGLVVWLLRPADGPPQADSVIKYKARKSFDASGYTVINGRIPPWAEDASLEEVAQSWRGLAGKLLSNVQQHLTRSDLNDFELIDPLIFQAMVHNYEGNPGAAYDTLVKARRHAESHPTLASEWLYTIIYFQGVCGLRQGENDNCVLCRGASSCIFPISPAARHTRPEGSRRAIHHFSEYLGRFPDDLHARWLLNLAHMTLGEHPDKVDPDRLLALDRFMDSQYGIGRFRDIGHVVGVNRFNQASGVVMEDFNGDGLLDLAVTSWDPTMAMVLYINKGDGTFEDITEKAGLSGQMGGLNLSQGDFDNDGRPDLFIVRGAWLKHPVRPSLLRNNGDGTFTDVTRAAGLDAAVNSNCAAWADYDTMGTSTCTSAASGSPTGWPALVTRSLPHWHDASA